MIKLGSNSIGKIYLGSNSIGKAYLGGNLVFQKGSSPTPTPGESIPYIRGGADGSYIDTGIAVDSTTKVIVWARNWNPMGGTLFGGRTAIDDAMLSIGTYTGASGAGTIRVDYASTHSTFSGYQLSNLAGYHKYELYQGVCKVDDVTVATATTGTFSSSATLHLFGNNNGGTHMNMSLPVDICACKIYKNDVLVRDYTAVNTPSVGLYDSLSGTTFTNAGAGSFTFGTFVDNAYTPLEYIVTDGASYFLTGVSGTYGLQAFVAFMPTGTTAVYYRAIGARNTSSSTSKIFEVATGNDTYRNARLYLTLGSSASTAYTSDTNDYLKDKLIIATKSNNSLQAFYNKVQVGSTITGSSSTSFDTGIAVAVGCTNHDGTPDDYFVGRIYYVNLGDYNFVPAIVNDVAGMYDTYHDVFYSSSQTPFTAGPTI